MEDDHSNIPARPEIGPDDDVVMVCGRTDDGAAIAVRAHNGQLSLAELRALEAGKPVHGDVISLRERAESPVLWDVDVVHEQHPTEGQRRRSGPARAANSVYRQNWEHIFGAIERDEEEPIH